MNESRFSYDPMEASAFVNAYLVKTCGSDSAQRDALIKDCVTKFDAMYADDPSAASIPDSGKIYLMLRDADPAAPASAPATDISSLAPTPASEKTLPDATMNFSAADMEAVKAKLESMKEDAKACQANSYIELLIFDRPSTATLFKDKETFKPNKEDALKKLQEYEKILVDTDENRANYEALLKAVQNDEELKIRKSDKMSKIIGVKVHYDSNDHILNMIELRAFMAARTQGVILAKDENSAGATLGEIKKRKGSDGRKVDLTTVRFKNRRAAEEHRNFAVSTQLSETETDMYSVRSELSFKVYVKNADGTKVQVNKKVNGVDTLVDKVRTVTLSGRTEAGKLYRSETYAKKFPMNDKDKLAKGLQAPVSEKALGDLQRMRIKTILQLTSSNESGYAIDKDIMAMLKNVAAGATNEAPAAVSI